LSSGFSGVPAGRSAWRSALRACVGPLGACLAAPRAGAGAFVAIAGAFRGGGRVRSGLGKHFGRHGSHLKRSGRRLEGQGRGFDAIVRGLGGGCAGTRAWRWWRAQGMRAAGPRRLRACGPLVGRAWPARPEAQGVGRRGEEERSMGDATLQAQINAARAYEALFVPALFGQWAPVVTDAAQVRPGGRVLDVGCGTGILAREIAPRTGPGGHLAGIDPGPGMLAVARQLAPAIEWREGVAEALPFPDQSFDAVASQFALMFATDRRQAVREMLRVLVPGGRLAIAVWDRLDSMPAYASEVALQERVAAGKAAAAPVAPLVPGNRKALPPFLAKAGLVEPGPPAARG